MATVPSSPAAVKAPRGTAVVHAWLLEPTRERLQREAQRLRLHDDALVAKLVEAALLLGIVDRVLELAAKKLASS
jgi:hypothetical protein